jgi:3-oxoacyl-[acyl-carrier protein] reductase
VSTSVAIVTGTARGIGAATAIRLSRDGFAVVGMDLDDGGPTLDRVLRGDVADPDTAAACVDAASQLGDLRVLVNNAGTVLDGAFASQSDQHWDDVHRSVVTGTRVMTRAVLARMRAAAADELAAGPDAVATPRRIISTVPAAAGVATAGASASASAGAAIAALTATLAREVGGFGIRVNAVLVGFVDTRLTGPLPPEAESQGADPSRPGPGLPEPVRQMAVATTALGRFGTPEEVAAVHAFLASSDADFITGAVIPATGGLLGT